ncbi:MAG: 5-bromo-4-chloroindolyl phosphate hydrolysis family protein [Acutalibacter sp.]|nr:5-bromo-4-chloroindolyl phosphate hydrolysis family protein [Acutalibacter sp.]
MKNTGSNPLEEEFRNSQIYKALKEHGIPVAEKVAEGLGKAVDALEKISPTGETKKAANYNQGTWQTAQPTGAQQNGTQNAGRQPVGTQGVYPGRKPQGVQPAPAPQMKLVHMGSPAKYYITGAAALFYAMNFPLYEISHFIIFGLVLAGAFLLSGKLFKGKKEFVPIEPEQPKVKEQPKQAEKPSATGNPEVDKIIDEGREYLKKLRAANDAIPEETLSEDIDRMEKASADIFRFVADHPEKAPQIRKFMNYYLPTTLKLLNSYQRLSAQSVRGENITSTMFNIAGMMHTVANAFEKQLDSLFTDEAMDVSADISVFETILKQEGFVDGEVQRKPGGKE